MFDTSNDDSVILTETDDSSNSDSDSDFDLSDPEAEFHIDAGMTPEVEHSDSISGSSSSEMEGSSSDDDCNSKASHLSCQQGRNFRGRGRGCGRGRGRATSITARAKKQTKSFLIHDLSKVDTSIPKTHNFHPSRSAGAHLSIDIGELTPADIFKLYFDSVIVQKICDSTNEYAEIHKIARPTMYRYFKQMVPDDFYALVGILIHMGYRRIPRYRLMWNPTSLCYEPLISKVFSRNSFESYLSFFIFPCRR